MATAESLPGYGLIRPTMADALVAVHRAHGPNAVAVWAQLLRQTQLAGHETDDPAFLRMLGAMAEADPLTRIAARSLQVRLRTFNSLAPADPRPAAARTLAESRA